MNTPILEIENLSIRIPHDQRRIAWVVRNLSLQILSSEIFGLIGESGSGKTMLGLAVMGLLPSNAVVEGSIRFLQLDLLSLAPDEMRHLRGNRLAMIFQDPMTSFNPIRRVGFQVAEPLMIHLREGRKQSILRSPELLERVRISDPERRVRQYPFELSGGMLQRAMIASATSLRPELLIADEPTSGLDVTIQAGVLALFRRMRDGLKTAVLLITHDLGVVAETCDRVAVMYAGEIVELGPVRDVINAPKHPYTQALLRATPDIDRPSGDLEAIAGSLPSPVDQREACRFIDRCPWAITVCDKHPELEDINETHQVRCWLATGDHR